MDFTNTGTTKCNDVCVSLWCVLCVVVFVCSRTPVCCATGITRQMGQNGCVCMFLFALIIIITQIITIMMIILMVILLFCCAYTYVHPRILFPVYLNNNTANASESLRTRCSRH